MKGAEFTRLKGVNEIDQYIYQNDDIFLWDIEIIKEVQHKLIKNAYEYHYCNCKEYRYYSDKIGVNPQNILSFEDLSLIPVLPASAFKIKDILSVDADSIIKICTSSVNVKL